MNSVPAVDSPSEPTLGLYQCSQCQRSYTRIDHLDRHIRTHLQERPFQCHVCSKRFGRIDILKRHAQGHDTGNYSKRPRAENLSNRVSEACSACALAKVKCDETKPCARCRQLDIQCEHSGDSTLLRPSKKGRKSKEKSSLSAPTMQDVAYDGQAPVIPDNDPLPQTLSPPDQPHNDNPSSLQSLSFRDDTNHFQQSTFPDNQFSDFLRDVFAQDVSTDFSQYDNATWSSADHGSRGLLDITVSGGFGSESHEMEGFLGELQDMGSLLPPHIGDYLEISGDQAWVPMQTLTRLDLTPANNVPHEPKKEAGIGVEAFRKSSLSRWLPAQKDGLEAELNQLSKLSGEADSPDSRLCLDNQETCEPLLDRTRDALLVAVVSVRGQEEGSVATSTFPSRELLDGLIRVFLAHSQASASSATHIPTFNPNSLNMVHLVAIIAEGAILSNNTALQRFGFVLQEVVRIGIHKACEASNAVTREFWLLQASKAEIDIGLWSGNRRKMEIAESHTQVLITMLRRAGSFQKSRLPGPVPLPEDSGDALQQKWQSWVRHESYRRLAFEVFLSDAQTSMSLFVNPLISYAEMVLPLPAIHELWVAKNAEQWKTIFLDHSPSATEHPNLISLLQQPLDLTELDGLCDLRYSTLIALHGMWALIWEHTQLASITGTGLVHSQAALSLRHQDLCSALEQLRMALADTQDTQTPQTVLTLELLSMYLHISMEKIQLFAGKEDLEEARRVLPSLKEWVNISPSRRAVWHAGQILRAARDFEPGTLRSFHAIAVYHASLTCWTYGLVSQMGIPNTAHTPANPRSSNGLVLLDGETCHDVQRFIALGRGTPCIDATKVGDGTADPILLSDSAALMTRIRKLLLGDSFLEAMPPLNENLTQLMMDLGQAGSSVAGTTRPETSSIAK